MTREEAKKLLGGYATGTLTPHEQQALFTAALSDQELFNALMQEQSLKEVLDDRTVRAELLQSLERPERPSWWKQPWTVPAAAGAILMATLTVVMLTRPAKQPVPVMVAEAPVHSAPAVPPQAEPAPPPIATTTAHPRAKAKPVPARTPVPDAADQLAKVAPPPPPALPAQPPAAASPKSETTNVAQAIPTPPAVPMAAPAPAQSTAGFLPSAQPQPVQVQAEAAAIGGLAPSDQARQLFYAAAAPGSAGASPLFRARTAKRKEASRLSGNATAATSAPAVAAPAFGLRYSIANSDPGLSVDVTVEANTSSYLYVFRRTSSEDWVAVTPGGSSLGAHVPASLPQIPLKDTGGEARVLFILSRTAMPELAATGAELTAAVERVRAEFSAARLLTQRASDGVYLVENRPDAQRLVAAATLK